MKETDSRWQLPKMSLWLMGYIVFTGFFCVGILTHFWRGNHGGSLPDAFWGTERARPSITSVLLPIPFLACLVWFTFFSTSRLVKKDDKIFVLLMFAGSIVGGSIQLVRHLFAH
jgi:hypothetical protein